MDTALITGASRGFGRALATALAGRGWDLVIDARSASDLRETAERLSGGGRVTAIPGDVTDPAHAVDLVEAAAASGRFRLLVNNAGTLGASPLPPLADYPLPSLDDVLAANVVAPLRLIQLSLPHLRTTRGTIVNMSSDAGVAAYPGWGGYGLAKAALDQLSMVLAVEEPGVRVIWFDPGDMWTRMNQDAYPGEDISDRPLPETRVPALVSLLDSDHPSGRYVAERLLANASAG